MVSACFLGKAEQVELVVANFLLEQPGDLPGEPAGTENDEA